MSVCPRCSDDISVFDLYGPAAVKLVVVVVLNSKITPSLTSLQQMIAVKIHLPTYPDFVYGLHHDTSCSLIALLCLSMDSILTPTQSWFT